MIALLGMFVAARKAQRDRRERDDDPARMFFIRAGSLLAALPGGKGIRPALPAGISLQERGLLVDIGGVHMRCDPLTGVYASLALIEEWARDHAHACDASIVGSLNDLRAMASRVRHCFETRTDLEGISDDRRLTDNQRCTRR